MTFFYTSRCPDRLWGPPNGYRGLFHRSGGERPGREAIPPLPIRLHGVVRNLAQINTMEFGRKIIKRVKVGGPGSHPRRACGVCGELSGTGAGFLRVLRFPLPIMIPPISPSLQSPGVGTICLLVAAVPSGPNWTPPPTIPINEAFILLLYRFCLPESQT
jgi:hypothetical protein